MAGSVIEQSPSPLLEAMEDNLHAHVAFLQRQLPGMYVEDRGDLLLVDSGLQTDTFNKILRARLDESNADLRIEYALEYFAKAKRPYAWWVGPCSRPLDLEHRLARHGLYPAEFEAGMAMSSAELLHKIPMPQGLRIKRLDTREEIEAFAAPYETIQAFYRQASPVLLHEDCPMRLFGGFIGEDMVATSELFLGGGAGGIHSVSTKEEFRGRGIGLAMSWTAANEARVQGLKTLTLQASEQGLPIYRRLGFEVCCRFVEYQPTTPTSASAR
jgi:ribosomal protein S18 acetylase RimI-like enzyme